MNYDKLTDTLDKKMLDFNLKLLGILGSLLIKPLAMCTEPFFRKNFGERYFTVELYGISTGLWLVAQMLNNITGGMEATPLQSWLISHSWQGLANDLSPKNISLVMAAAYGAIGMYGLIKTRSRQGTGENWHSMSRGESIVGLEGVGWNVFFAVFIVVLLGLVAWPLSFLFLVSQGASYYLAAKQQASFYNRYLDAMDAKIEAENLQRALDKGEPPSENDGLNCPLPKVFKGKHRTRVARVVAGGGF